MLGIEQCRLAQLFDVSPRCVRRWQRGERHLPRGIAVLLRLLITKTITVEQVEQASVPIPVRMNGHAKALPALLREERPPERTTAEKVFALALNACRYPIGDPQRPDFRFCGCPSVAGKPYCARHFSMAYAPITRSKHRFIFAKKPKAELKEEELA
jgi:hypothetical protein